MLEELVKSALVGTARGATALPSVTGPLGEALAALPAAAAEQSLLSAAALLSAYESCGRIPRRESAVPTPAAPDARSPCTQRGGELLERILAMPQTPAQQQLAQEWLHGARQARRNPPHRLLPALLNYGASTKTARPAISAVVDERGRWLVGQNAAWQYTVDDTVDAEQIWSTGTQDQRIAALRRMRERDPAAARTLIGTTWKEDSAEERANFVAALAVGLSLEDEPLLESALDDRSKQVRAAAVDLLVRLPQSALARRMIARAGGLLELKRASGAGTGGKGAPATIELTLPNTFDPAWSRDGITEKPSQRMGEKQWWVQQMLAAIPPTHWSSAWQCNATACIAAATGDFGDLILDAWADAAERHPDAAWAAALLMAAGRDGRGNLRVQLLNVLTESSGLSIFGELSELPQLPIAAVSQLVSGSGFGFDRRAANGLFSQIDRHTAGAGAGFDYQLHYIFGAMALRLPPELHDEIAARWAGPYWEGNHKALDACLATMQIRRDIQREFAT